MTIAARRLDVASALSLRPRPALVALALLALVLIAPALSGFDAPRHAAEDWRGNSAGSSAR